MRLCLCVECNEQGGGGSIRYKTIPPCVRAIVRAFPTPPLLPEEKHRKCDGVQQVPIGHGEPPCLTWAQFMEHGKPPQCPVRSPSPPSTPTTPLHTFSFPCPPFAPNCGAQSGPPPPTYNHCVCVRARARGHPLLRCFCGVGCLGGCWSIARSVPPGTENRRPPRRRCSRTRALASPPPPPTTSVCERGRESDTRSHVTSSPPPQPTCRERVWVWECVRQGKRLMEGGRREIRCE